MCPHELDDLAHPQRRREPRFLGRHPDRKAGAHLSRIDSEDLRGALVGATQAKQDRERGRLPSAVRADEGDDLSCLDREVHAVERDRLPEALRHRAEGGGNQILRLSPWTHQSTRTL